VENGLYLISLSEAASRGQLYGSWTALSERLSQMHHNRWHTIVAGVSHYVAQMSTGTETDMDDLPREFPCTR
jgi:hypothetical protein